MVSFRRQNAVLCLGWLLGGSFRRGDERVKSSERVPLARPRHRLGERSRTACGVHCFGPGRLGGTDAAARLRDLDSRSEEPETPPAEAAWGSARSRLERVTFRTTGITRQESGSPLGERPTPGRRGVGPTLRTELAAAAPRAGSSCVDALVRRAANRGPVFAVPGPDLRAIGPRSCRKRGEVEDLRSEMNARVNR